MHNLTSKCGLFPNLFYLCREPSKRMPGRPFKLSKAIPVDMFPNTSHFELILIFER